MGDVVGGAAREMWDMLVGAATNPGPWVYVLLVIAAVAVTVVMFRSRRMVWLFLPMLAGLAYWSWRRFT